MRKVLLVTGLAVLAALALAYLFRSDLALRAMDRALARTMAGDAIAALPDGLHLAVCGAGGPLPSLDRSGACLAVVAGRRLFIVDAGTNGARNLQRMGLPAARAEAVLLTHFHSDHIDGLGELLMLHWTGGAAQSPMPVYGPSGVQQVVAGFNAAYALDSGYRTAHHGPSVAPPAGAGGVARTFATPQPGQPVTIIEGGGVRVQAFKVDHDPARPAVGYRFDYAGRSLVISGDTKKIQETEEISRNVDLLVHEALSADLVGLMNRNAAAAGLANVAKITHDILDYHTTPVEAAEIAAAAGVGHLLLYHIVPPLPLPGLDQAFLAGVADAYQGPVTLSRDGTFVSMPAGTTEMLESQRL
ncbi:MAG: MBL fold metallo-hydrolase [Pseudomonadales bacterium]